MREPITDAEKYVCFRVLRKTWERLWNVPESRRKFDTMLKAMRNTVWLIDHNSQPHVELTDHEIESFNLELIHIPGEMLYEVLTLGEVATRLRLSKPTVLKLIHEKKLDAKKMGRGWKVTEDALRAFMHKEE